MRSQRGFTIVEISIVMIVVGLLIGGILGGQELYQNQQVRSIQNQTVEIDAAFSMFKKAYGELPGDLSDPATLPNCTIAPCSTPGDGDGRINAAILAWNPPLALNDERVTAWAHLKAAKFLSGYRGGTTIEPGDALPDNARKGPFLTGVAEQNSAWRALLGQNIIFPAASALKTGGVGDSWRDLMTVNEVRQIDTKIDDGVAASGRLQSSTECVNGANVYDPNLGQLCTFFFILSTQN